MNPTTGTARCHLLAAVLLSILPLSVVADGGCTDSLTTLKTALLRAAADRIDAILGAVADSTRALGDTYGRLAAAQGDEGSPDRERWLARRTTRGNTTGLRTWPLDLGSPPASQAPLSRLGRRRHDGHRVLSDLPGRSIARRDVPRHHANDHGASRATPDDEMSPRP